MFYFLAEKCQYLGEGVMPRIDPAQLLKTLGVLLGPHGGIKSPEEVNIWSESHSEVKC